MAGETIDRFLFDFWMAKKYGITVMHHSCGSIRKVIPLLIERDLDILQAIQPEAADMNAADLHEEFGEDLKFQGGISIQQTLPFGSHDEIRVEVRTRKNTFEKNQYILCTSHNVQADVSVESAEVLLDEYRKP
jgi:uroporphyrinogen decarboxylase